MAGLAVDTRPVETTGRSAGEVIIEEAKKWPTDLIVIGAHGRRGPHRLMLGSHADYVMRAAPVPVLLLRIAKMPRPRV